MPRTISLVAYDDDDSSSSQPPTNLETPTQVTSSEPLKAAIITESSSSTSTTSTSSSSTSSTTTTTSSDQVPTLKSLPSGLSDISEDTESDTAVDRKELGEISATFQESMEPTAQPLTQKSSTESTSSTSESTESEPTVLVQKSELSEQLSLNSINVLTSYQNISAGETEVTGMSTFKRPHEFVTKIGKGSDANEMEAEDSAVTTIVSDTEDSQQQSPEFIKEPPVVPSSKIDPSAAVESFAKDDASSQSDSGDEPPLIISESDLEESKSANEEVVSKSVIEIDKSSHDVAEAVVDVKTDDVQSIEVSNELAEVQKVNI